MLINTLPLIAFFGLFFFFIMRITLKAKKQSREVPEINVTELSDPRRKVLVVSANVIPGKEIKDVIGHVCATSRIEASTPRQAEAAEKDAMLNLMKSALEMGANAVIDAKFSTGTFEQQGSKWMVSKAYYSGTAVVI